MKEKKKEPFKLGYIIHQSSCAGGLIYLVPSASTVAGAATDEIDDGRLEAGATTSICRVAG